MIGEGFDDADDNDADDNDADCADDDDGGFKFFSAIEPG